MNWKPRAKHIIIAIIILIPIAIYIYRPQPVLSDVSKNYITIKYYDWYSHTTKDMENEELEQEVLNYLDNCKMRFAFFYKSDDNDTPHVRILMPDITVFLGRWKYVYRNGVGYRIINGDKVLEDIKEIINKYEAKS